MNAFVLVGSFAMFSSPKKKLDSELNEFWRSLGEFLTTFSQTERLLRQLLAKLAGVKPKIAIALFSGTRVDAATSYINRLLVAINADRKTRAELQRLFTHLGKITQIRNDILHYGGLRYKSNIFLASNYAVALTDAQARVTFLTAKSLSEMNADLVQINQHLAVHITKLIFARPVLKGFPRRKPWLYKPLQLSAGQKRRRSKPPKQKHPPRSSPA